MLQRPDDNELTFFLLVYHNYSQAASCLARLRKHYPTSRVVIRSDGDKDARHGRLAEAYRAEFHCEDRLFPVENGGAIVCRMFELFLERPTRFLFKIDPDAVIHRRFRYLPSAESVFGTIQGPDAAPSIQGGCMGFTQGVARRLASSHLLSHDDLKSPQRRRHDGGYWRILARRADRAGLTSFDWTIAWAARQLQIPIVPFEEVHCTWKTPIDNHDLRFAVTHPACPEQDTAIA